MKISKNFLLCFCLCLISNTRSFAQEPSLESIENALKTTGQTGWIHGSSPNLGLFVFTVREPGNFFSHREFPLVAGTKALEQELFRLNRHDEVRIRGSFLNNHAPIQHILVDSLEILTKQDVLSQDEYVYEVELPKELEGKKEILGKIHAIAHQGKVLVLDYKDGILPVFVQDPGLTQHLFRNDIVNLKIKLKSYPHRPSHLILDSEKSSPVTVVDSIKAWHEKKGILEGALVLFPKSPQVVFNVFALQVSDASGIKREFTLVNFENTETFEKIRNKLQALWDRNPSGAINGRNKLVQPQLRLRATGTFNVMDPGQANPQILLKDEKSVELVFQ